MAEIDLGVGLLVFVVTRAFVGLCGNEEDNHVVVDNNSNGDGNSKTIRMMRMATAGGIK